MPALNYYRRVLQAYLNPGHSQLSFWHDHPQASRFEVGSLGDYYMPFVEKADYPGPFDDAGIPLLDYRGRLGRQYNPIAIAQYGLGNYNLYHRTHSCDRRCRFLKAANWLVDNLEQNSHGVWVWNHKFDFEYRTPLRAPWYSGLAQGQGISLLVRAYSATGAVAYLQAAQQAFAAMLVSVEKGGVAYADAHGFTWIEEYIVSPPTHILNGFIWATWGVHDYWLATADPLARELFERVVATLAHYLPRYDAGFWSLYEQNNLPMMMLASPFYHRLHIVQLAILYALTSIELFEGYSRRWAMYQHNRLNRVRALAHKSIYKLRYY